MAVESTNEITVRVKGDLEDFYKTIKEKGFEITDKFKMDDTFFIPQNLDLENMTAREILANAVLVRIVERRNGKLVKNITYKNKVFDEAGNILSQSKVECEILNPEDAKKLFSAIGFKEIMRIKESDIVFEKDGVLLVKRVAAVPGDTVDLSQLTYMKSVPIPVREETIITVPEDCYFVLGDNSQNSWDSRYWNEGYILSTEVVALVRFAL